MRRFLSKPLGLTWRTSTKAQIEANGKIRVNDARLKEVDPTSSRTISMLTNLRGLQSPLHSATTGWLIVMGYYSCTLFVGLVLFRMNVTRDAALFTTMSPPPLPPTASSRCVTLTFRSDYKPVCVTFSSHATDYGCFCAVVA